MILEHLAVIAESNNWSLQSPIDLGTFQKKTTNPTADESVNKMNLRSQQNSGLEDSTSGETTLPTNGSLLSSLRGGAGSFLKNLKDTSAKMMQSVQQSMVARNDLDISYITSRLLVMPSPSEGLEAAYKINNIDDVRLYIESRFALQKVSVYNFGSRSCPRLPPPVRTVEASGIYICNQARAPELQVSWCCNIIPIAYSF